MISSTLKFALSISLVLSMLVQTRAQISPKKEQTNTISGKVTVKGNGVAGIFVGARPASSGAASPTFGATTDPNGNYRITNLPTGTYEIMPGAPQFVLSGYPTSKTLIVSAGETVEGVDFALVRGGVITGKVTDADGRPVVEEGIELSPVEAERMQPSMYRMLMARNNMTDDRGVYRIFGVPAGKYRVSAGVSEERLNFGGRRIYRQTFHPSATDSSKATIIEVTEGSEATNVDIVVSRMQAIFTVSGRIVDGETGRPIANASYGLQKFRTNGSSATGAGTSNGLGEFKFDNLTVGKYAVYVEPLLDIGSYVEPVPFEVTDHDLTDLVVRTSPGGSISGVVVFEGEKANRNNLANFMLHVWVSREEDVYMGGSTPATRVSPDGSFKATGLRRGLAQFTFFTYLPGLRKGYEITRVERDGVAQPRGIEIKDGEHVSGVRLVVTSSSGAIRGVVKMDNGDAPPTQRLFMSVNKIGEKTESISSPRIDARGRFFIDRLPAGVYELSVMLFMSDSRRADVSTKQQVVVADDQVSEVTFTLSVPADSPPTRRP